MARNFAPRGLSPRERIMMMCDRPSEDECWLWSLALNKDGYGYIKIDGTHWRAHRAAYQFLVAPIPDGMTVDHECFNTACVNPAHLRLLTNAENARRRRNVLDTHCNRGHLRADHVISQPDGRQMCGACRSVAASNRKAS